MSAINEKSIHLLSDPGIYWDGEVPGFGLRVFPSGAKSFIFQYRLNGREYKRTIGKWPALALRAARDLARQKYTLVRAGVDPFPRESARSVTLSEFSEIFLTQWATQRNKPKTLIDVKRRIEKKIIPCLGKKRIDQISRVDIQRFIANETQHSGPIEANRCLALLCKMFNCAIDWGYLPDNASNPASRIQKNPEKGREFCLDNKDIGLLIEAIDSEPEILVRNGLWLYLLTGLRKMELLSRTWSDIDFDRKMLRFEDTKAGRPFYLPLSEEAIERFRELKNQTVRYLGNPYVFPNHCGSHLQDFPRTAWSRIRAKAQLPSLTIHGLRHTVASRLAIDGVSLKKIGGLLNQSSQSITDRYAHLQAEELRPIAEEHGKKIKELAIKTR